LESWLIIFTTETPFSKQFYEGGKEKLSILSVISLSLMHTKKPHTGAG